MSCPYVRTTVGGGLSLNRSNPMSCRTACLYLCLVLTASAAADAPPVLERLRYR